MKYRISPNDVINDVWNIMARRRWYSQWWIVGQGTKSACEAKVRELTAPKAPGVPSQNTGLYRLGEGGVLIPERRPAQDAEEAKT